METTFDFDGSEWGAQVIRMNRQLGIESTLGLTEQCKLLIKEIIDLTPPHNRTEGRTRTRADISKAIKPFNVTSFKSERLEEIVNQQDYQAFDAFMRNVPNDALKNARAVPFREDIHQRSRDNRGRIRHNDRKRFVLGRGDVSRLRAYVKRKMANVGLARSGWASAAWALGVTLPGWIANQLQRGQSNAINRLNDPDEPSFTAINSSPWANNREEGQRVLGYAMRYRVKAMEAFVRRALIRAAEASGIDVKAS
jgi:hypothetical protein